MSFAWDGNEIATIGDLFDGAVSAMRAGRAQEYFDAYAATNERAAQNLGYVFGYGDDNTRRELYQAFGVIHPVFGGAV